MMINIQSYHSALYSLGLILQTWDWARRTAVKMNCLDNASLKAATRLHNVLFHYPTCESQCSQAITFPYCKTIFMKKSNKSFQFYKEIYLGISKAVLTSFGT